MRHQWKPPAQLRSRTGGVYSHALAAVVSFLVTLFGLNTPATSASPEVFEERPPFGTYSIVARDPQTKQIGVAVQSHFFAVGTVVTWAWPGVGAVATQANGAARFGPQGLAMLADGVPPKQAIEALLASDKLSETRQVGMVDAQGRSYAHSGDRVISDHCHHTGTNLSIQANIMAKPGVCDAMVEAFKTKSGDLAARLFAALKAAQAAGGDLRGEQAAALLVVDGNAKLPRWGGRLFDIRVDNSKAPLRDLAQLMTIARNMNMSNAIQANIRAGRFDEAAQGALALRDRVGPINENFVWIAIAYAAAGKDDAAMALLKPIVTSDPKWQKAIPRLIDTKYLPDREPYIGLTPKAASKDGQAVPQNQVPVSPQ